MKILLSALLLSLALDSRAAVLTGIDVLEESGFAALQGKRVGLITNQTGKNRAGRSIVDVLADAPGVALVRLFSPEHGFMGLSEEHVVGSSAVVVRGREIPVASLYEGGIKGMRPKPGDLKDLDALVFDIQDIGARFYTYAASMAMALEEANKAQIAFVVLDRPNPINGVVMEGTILEDLTLREVTPTAYFAIPVRHGLTMGEIAWLHNAEVQHPALTVVRMKGWKRRMWFDETGLPWTPPSPNMPDLDAATLYPGVGCFEASNLSVGRGTPFPFRWIGAPWLKAGEIVARLKKAKLAGVSFESQAYVPAKSVHAGVRCEGVRMTITNRDKLRPLEVFAHLAAALRDTTPQFEWRWEEVRRMVGTDAFKTLYLANKGPKDFVSLFKADIKPFSRKRKPILMY